MTQIQTDMRVTQESARRIRFEPVSPFTATDVQTAIRQAASLPSIITPTAVSVGMSPYTPLASDQLLLVDTAGGPITILMPLSAARGNLDLEIKDDTGHAFLNNISVTFSGGQTADGLSPYAIDGNYGAVKLGSQAGGYFVHA